MSDAVNTKMSNLEEKINKAVELRVNTEIKELVNDQVQEKLAKIMKGLQS